MTKTSIAGRTFKSGREATSHVQPKVVRNKSQLVTVLLACKAPETSSVRAVVQGRPGRISVYSSLQNTLKQKGPRLSATRFVRYVANHLARP